MNELINVLSQDGNLVVSSREVAENFEKQNKHVMEAIRELETSVENSTHLFIPSTYKDTYGREQKEYLLTRDGFTLLAMGFTGSKALQWKLKYIEAFNKMEEVIASGLEGLSVEMQALIMHDKKIQAVIEHIETHDKKLDKLESTMVIDYGQQRVLEKLVGLAVITALGGKESNAYKEISKKVFSECNRDIKDRFLVNSRNNIPKLKFEEACNYIKRWQPCTNTKILIEDTNAQINIA
jgi:Rha family phage regulatory protein